MNVFAPSAGLLTIVTKPFHFGAFTFRFGLLVIGWESEGDYFLNVRKIPLLPEEATMEVLLILDGTGAVSSDSECLSTSGSIIRTGITRARYKPHMPSHDRRIYC